MSKLEIIFRWTDDEGTVRELNLPAYKFLIVLDHMKHIDDYQITELERLLTLCEWTEVQSLIKSAKKVKE